MSCGFLVDGLIFAGTVHKYVVVNLHPTLMNIRGSFALVVTLLIFGMGSRAEAQPIELGISAGINLSTHTDKYLYSGGAAFTPNQAVGYQLGIMARRDLSELFRLQIEPSIIKLGARYQQSFSQQDTEMQTDSWTRLIYLQWPVLTQISLDSLEESLFGRSLQNTSLHFTGGLFWNYLLDARFVGTNYAGRSFEAIQQGKFSKDVKNNYSKYDTGIIVGVGMEYDHRIGFDTRLQYTALQSYNGKPMYKPKNVAVTFSLTYLILP